MLPRLYAWLVDPLGTEREGQGLVEYALVIILVSIVAMSALAVMGTQVRAIFERISAAVAAG